MLSYNSVSDVIYSVHHGCRFPRNLVFHAKRNERLLFLIDSIYPNVVFVIDMENLVVHALELRRFLSLNIQT